MNPESHVPLRKWISFNLPAQSILLLNTENIRNICRNWLVKGSVFWRETPRQLLFQDFPVCFMKLQSLSFGSGLIFLKYLQSMAKSSVDQMPANPTCDTATPPDKRKREQHFLSTCYVTGTRPAPLFMFYPRNKLGRQTSTFHPQKSQTGPTQENSFGQHSQRKTWKG